MIITIGDLRELSRILRARRAMKRENFHPVKRYEGGEYHAFSAPAQRTSDGTGNDPTTPYLGRAGEPFMRNVPLSALADAPDMSNPDPRVVSERLLHNHSPRQLLAPRINLLAAAWLQFQVHDWFEHATDPNGELTLDATSSSDALHLQRTMEVGSAMHTDVPIFANTQGHWWDGSQLYGRSRSICDHLREKDEHGNPTAKLRLDDDGRLPFEAPLPELGVEEERVELSGFIKNWWIGLSALHTLLAREHNAIVDALREAAGGPDEQSEEWLFQKARLITSALIAKIQTIEWTPSLLRFPAIQFGLLADWWGIGPDHADDRLANLVARTSHLPAGMPLTPDRIDQLVEQELLDEMMADPLKDLLENGTPPARLMPSPKETAPDGSDIVYAMSEEFVAAYRMHALLVDPVPLRTTDGTHEELPLSNVVTAGNSRALGDNYGIGNLLYSLAKASPAALRLNNYPRALTAFRSPGKEGQVDLGAVDVLRDRERRLPRYSAFKRAISKIRGPELDSGPAIEFRTFSDICGDPDEPGIAPEEAERRTRDARLLAETYASPNDVDLLVGMLAEPLPPGFSFSWTAFEIFLLMTLLRLSADRFYTTDYNVRVYTQTGIDWINNNDMTSVLSRHYGAELDEMLRDGENPFLIESWR